VLDTSGRPTRERTVPAFSPFRGVRYDVARLGCGHEAVAAPPYDVIDDDERIALEGTHARNVVRLTLPQDTEVGDRYRQAGARLDAWRRDGTLVVDPAPRFYRYRMTFPDGGRERTTTGVLGALELAPLGPGGVLPHERTLPKAKSDRLDLMRTTHANLEPIWGLSAATGLTALLDGDHRVLARCNTDGVTHEVAAIDDPAAQQAIADAVAAHPVVLADGHHRYETALTYRAERRAEGHAADGDDAILALVVELADEELCVRPIHRLVQGGTSVLDRIDDWYDVVAESEPDPAAVDGLLAELAARGAIALVRPTAVQVLVVRPEVAARALADTVPALRAIASAVTDATVEPALVAAGATITYRHDAAACTRMVLDGAYDAAILLRPATVAEIRAVADAGTRMPPKTTFFSPKPASGIVLRQLDT
jgi:uncharacterized protein (DUF1015 family)